MSAQLAVYAAEPDAGDLGVLAGDELIVVGFAGGGGSSEAIRMATGREPDIAINHEPEAIAMHRANHPSCEHFCQNIWQVHPRKAVRGRKVGLAWFSPDCTDFSKAKGGRPVSKRVRDLAWVVVLWAKVTKPRVIFLENVEEFRDWGPLADDGQPCPDRRGLEFRRWVKELKRLGYAVDWREIRASEFGAPTIRKRLFLVARRDDRRIAWAAPTHGKGLRPFRTAAECIDWSIPCPSIFLTREEGRALGVNRPLAEATMRRIGRGVWRYVINAARPFIVPVTHAGDDRVHSIDEGLRTVTTANRGEHALISPYLVPRYGERPPKDGVPGQAPRTAPVDAPIATITPTQNEGSLIAPVLMPYYGERREGETRAHDVGEPLKTQTTENRFGLAAVHLAEFRGDSAGKPVDGPMPTITANSFVKRPGGAPPQGVVAAFLAQHNTDMVGHDVRKPMSTIVGKGCTQAVVSSHLVKLRGTCADGQPVDEPAPTFTSGGWHVGEVRAFLLKYYDTAVGQPADEPLHTATVKARFGLVTVEGVEYQIVDIGMRMLTPRELFNAQGFRPDYIIDPMFAKRDKRGRFRRAKPLTKTAQIHCVGNSVSPPPAAAIIAANFPGYALRAAA